MKKKSMKGEIEIEREEEDRNKDETVTGRDEGSIKGSRGIKGKEDNDKRCVVRAKKIEVKGEEKIANGSD
ncbi:hypothetical protein Pmani_031990 [Petrolisthes manimaculis]|uniref:Uncharacterized protein n=1 Tax=Petrolisthes manimaculis TaxID=1843537 RepID=A0AAE1TS30_9EUCA|nr:hypothetical protein Pmani_031990 [Petrolisthes manimaculis]